MTDSGQARGITPVPAGSAGSGPVSGYRTLAGEHRHELELRRSRFITVLRRVETEEDVRAMVAGLRREFPDARHHCSAFLLGPERNIRRSSDDSEPGGTAGVPMLEALAGFLPAAPGGSGPEGLSDVAAVVVRYFGGVLLGAGGLVRAYSDSVSQALAGARLVRRQRLQLVAVRAPHAAAGRLEHELRSGGAAVIGTEYADRHAVIRLALPDEPDAVAGFSERLAALTAGAGTPELLERRWTDLD